jgi:hypothetical protein
MYSPWGEFKGERDENLWKKIFGEKNLLIFKCKFENSGDDQF